MNNVHAAIMDQVKYYSAPAGNANEKAFQKQLEEEKRLLHLNQKSLGYFGTSNPVDLEYLSRHLDTLEPEKVEEIVSGQFYNLSIFKSLSEILNSVIYYTGSDFSANLKIREYLRGLQQIGADSVQGIAMKANLISEGSQSRESAENLFVLKVPQKPDDTELIHEAFVGLYGTNSLRQFVPNFAYVFGLFECSGPALDQKKVLTWCIDPNKKLPYIVYENISPSISIDELCKMGSLSEILNAYLQILYALQLGSEKIGFGHNDLHNQNVLIRKLDKTAEIPYLTTPGKIEFMRVDFVATIIDFGFSHIVYQGKDYGITGLEKYGIQRESRMIFRDAYKLLLFCLESLKRYGRRDSQGNYMYLRFENLVRRINGNVDIDTVIKEQRNIYYILPDWDIYRVMNLYQWASLVRQEFPNETAFFADTPSTEVLSCSYSTCLNVKDFEEQIGLFQPLKAENYLQFYDLTSQKLTAEQKAKVVETFDVSTLSAAREDLSRKYDDIVLKFSQLKAPVAEYSGFLDPINLPAVQAYAGNMASIVDDFDRLMLHTHALNYTLKYFHSPQLILPELNRFFSILQSSLQSFHTTIEKIATLPGIKDNKALSWYLTDLPRFLNVKLT